MTCRTHADVSSASHENVRIRRKCACGAKATAGGSCAACVEREQQRKIAIGSSNDPLEHEADRVADEVMRGPAGPITTDTPSSLAQSRRSATGDGPSVEAMAPASVHRVLGQSGRPLDADARTFFEGRFNRDFSAVRIHSDGEAAASARAVNAHAYTLGNHVIFGAGRYDPVTRSGRRLLAHELTHTVQQRDQNHNLPATNPSLSSASTSALEAEADQAAERADMGNRVSVNLKSGRHSPQFQKSGSTPAPPTIVPPVDPSAKQQKVIDDARRAAAGRTQLALFKANGIQGALDYQMAKHLAQIKFDWDDPNMEQVAEILGKMGGGLINVPVKVAGPNDPECGNRAGYVRAHKRPIVLCPGFFKASSEDQVRTMIHEMAHIVGIGSAGPGEQYFPTFDCDSRGDFSSADSWANYVHCLSGQTPDKPMVITGKAGGSSTQPTPKSGTKP